MLTTMPEHVLMILLTCTHVYTPYSVEEWLEAMGIHVDDA